MRSRAQRKLYRKMTTGITQQMMLERKIRFAALEMNELLGPDRTAAMLYKYTHLFRTDGIFRDAATLEWEEGKRDLLG